MKQIVETAIDDGYKRLKFKVHPSYKLDLEYLYLLSHKTKISLDANGSFEFEDFEYLKELSQFNTAIEQPFALHRIDLVENAKEQIENFKICYDEEVECLGDLMKLDRLKIIDELNIKPGRVGGIYNSIKIADYCFEKQIPCWVGGMFETGIGRSLNLSFASRLSGKAIHDLSPPLRYFQEDILKIPISMTDGFIDSSHLENSNVDSEQLNKYIINNLSY